MHKDNIGENLKMNLLINNIDKCILCNHKIHHMEPKMINEHMYQYWNCDTCGDVILSNSLYKSIEVKGYYKDDLWLLSIYCKRRAMKNLPSEPIDADNIDEIIKNMKSEIPKTIAEAQNKLIKQLGDKLSSSYGIWKNYDFNLEKDTLINDRSKLIFLMNALKLQNFIELNPPEAFGTNKPQGNFFRLTLSGFEKYESLKTTSIDSNDVFIAMWYNKKTDKLKEAIKAAVKAAKYNPIIANEEPYTGNIMDYILSKIRQSKFVISDFTVEPESPVITTNNDEPEYSKITSGTRGGVYYETGYAKSLGLQVIHLCKDNNISKNRLHFDIAQENTIFWSDDDVETSTIREDSELQSNPSPINLAEKLFDTIKKIFGMGNIN